MVFSGDPPPASYYASVGQSLEMYECGVSAGFTSTAPNPPLRPMGTPMCQPMRLDVSLFAPSEADMNINTVTASSSHAPTLDYYAFQQQQPPPPPPPGVFTNVYYDYVSTFIRIMIS